MRIQSDYLTGSIRGGTLERPLVYTVDAYANNIQETVQGLTSGLDGFTLEPRNWYAEFSAPGMTANYIFGNVWTLWANPYAEVDAYLSYSATATNATGPANEFEAQLVASAMTLGLDTCLP